MELATERPEKFIFKKESTKLNAMMTISLARQTKTSMAFAVALFSMNPKLSDSRSGYLDSFIFEMKLDKALELVANGELMQTLESAYLQVIGKEMVEDKPCVH